MSHKSDRSDLHYSDGNLKYKNRVGHKMMIINQGSATSCPGRKLGLCQLDKKSNCYAYKAEVQYPCVLKFRKLQKKQWDKTSASDLIAKIKAVQDTKRNKLTHLRFAEAGDFMVSWDVVKLYHIAEGLKKRCNMDTFVYTARRDIMSKNLVKALSDKFPTLVINGSGFMVHNEYRIVKDNYKPKHKKEIWCKNICHICRLCKVRGGFTILVKERDGKSRYLAKVEKSRQRGLMSSAML